MLSSCEDETVPATARINTVRAMAYEGLRLRCTTRSCRHRPQDADGQAEGICPDDQEAEGNTMDVDEDDEIELGATMDVDAAGGEDAEPYMVELFPFAKPIKYYENMLSTICHCETAPFLELLSRSAHPGAVIGGRAKGLEVIAYYGGVQTHNFNHGQALLESILTMRSWSQAKATTSVAIKRVRSHDMPFISAQAPRPEKTALSRPGGYRRCGIVGVEGWHGFACAGPATQNARPLGLRVASQRSSGRANGVWPGACLCKTLP